MGTIKLSSHMNEDGTLKPNQEYKAGENGYTYKTDANGNISSAHADELKFKTHDGRLNHNSNTAGKLPGDDAGHLFAEINLVVLRIWITWFRREVI